MELPCCWGGRGGRAGREGSAAGGVRGAGAAPALETSPRDPESHCAWFQANLGCCHCD